MLPLLLAVLAGVFPSTSKSSWMEPAAFRLTVGMTRAAAVERLHADGWKTKPGKAGNDLLVEFDEGRTLTLAFRGDRLVSIRFELIGFAPEVRRAFGEMRKTLSAQLGPPMERGTTLIYDKSTPNVMAVLSTDPKTSFGKQGLGFFVVRYFEPPPAE
jgi:hypothetical protein